MTRKEITGRESRRTLPNMEEENAKLKSNLLKKENETDFIIATVNPKKVVFVFRCPESVLGCVEGL